MTRHAPIALAFILSACSAPMAGPVRPGSVDDSGADEEPPPPAVRKDAAPVPVTTPDAGVKPDPEPQPPPPDAAPVMTGPDAGKPVEGTPTSPACTVDGKNLGPPTAAELKLVDDQYKAAPYVPAGTNMGNNFAYGTAGKRIGEMRTMFNLTGDVWYLDQAIKFADHMLAMRNDPMTGRILWTGKREPCWPNNAETAPDAGVCGMETGAVANQILQTAKVIFSNKQLWAMPVGGGDPRGYGATYEKRARTYLTEASKSIDWMVATFVDRTRNNEMHTPTDPAYGALGPNYLKALGRSIPWNQQEMLSSPLAAIGDILIGLKEDPARVAANDVIVKASLDWFISVLEANKYMSNGVTVYLWGYNPGDLVHVEDLAHASADINALYNAYKRGRYGIARETLVPIANTFFEKVIKPDGTYASHITGKGSRPAISASWTNYEEFRSGIIARLVPVLTVDAMTPPPDAVTRLNLRRKFCQ